VRKGIEQLDPAGAVRDVGRYIREQRRLAELSLRNLARQAGVSNPYLSQIERGLRQPSAKILKDIAKALRISAETLYLRAGILDENEREGDLVPAILRDPHLTERQKQVLIDVYRSFLASAEGGGAAAPDAAAASAEGAATAPPDGAVATGKARKPTGTGNAGRSPVST
jgi:transcriptional regulator with XRE-family HTH domain